MAASTYPQPLNATFTVAIRKDGAFATYFELPDSQLLLGTRAAVKVTGTLDGHPFAATLMPSGTGPHWLPLRAALCAAIGKNQASQPVSHRPPAATPHLRRRPRAVPGVCPMPPAAVPIPGRPR
jgi:hypothetical protein